jgi:hypothetical protein
MADESTETEEKAEVEETEEGTTEESTEEGTTEESEQEASEEGKSGEDWEAKARKRSITIKTERKKREDAEAKVKEYEDAQKSDSEKLTEKATTAEGRANQAEAKAVRLEIAIDKGLTGKQARAFAKRLVGETQEELEEDADELLASFKPKAEDEETEEASEEGKPEVKRRPTEKTKRTGATSRKEPEEMDPDKLAEAIPTTGF